MKLEVFLSNSEDAIWFDKDIPEGVSVSHPAVIITRGFGVEPTPINIAIAFGLATSSKIVASWIYDKICKCKSNKKTINRREIHLDKGLITKIIEESINEE